MKKLFSKSFAAIIISACIFQVPAMAQVKTNFTPEIRTSSSKPTGLVSGEHILEYNNVDVKMPKKTRGVIERYKKLNIWGNEIPDSFLFFRNVLLFRIILFYRIVLLFRRFLVRIVGYIFR